MIICVPITACTWMDASRPTTCFGGTSGIEIRYLDLGSGKSELARGLLYAQLPPEVIEAAIIKAELCLYWVSIDASVTANIYRVIQTGWTEAGATWNKYDGVTNWGGAGCNQGGVDIDGADTLGFTIPAAVCWQEIDITAWLRDIITNHSGAAHLRISLTSESGGTNRGGYFVSKDNTTFPAWRPFYKIVCSPFGRPREL
jgi:hypothetical protein